MAFLDETGLAELWELIKAEDAKGVKIASGSYAGTDATSKSITVGFTPKLIFVQKRDSYACMIGAGSTGTYITYGLASKASITFDTNSISLSASDASFAMNSSGNNYDYVAIG